MVALKIDFEFVGVVLGLALFHGLLIDMPLVPICFKVRLCSYLAIQHDLTYCECV
jgi:hypothetical protein